MTAVVDLVQQALAAHRQGNLAEATRLYEAALGIDATHVTALHMLGAARIQEGRFEDAIHLISEALSRAPDDPDALADLGFACESANRAEDAAAHYKHALTLRPDDVNTLFRLGAVELASGRPADAVISFTSALRLDPDAPATLVHRAAAFSAMSRYEEALRDLDRAVELNPDDAQAWYMRGCTAGMFGLDAHVVSSFAKARELDPGIDYLLGAFVHAKADLCDWRDRDREFSQLAASIDAGRHDCHPTIAIRLLDDPSRQLRCAKLAATRLEAPAQAPALVSMPGRRKRIRVAYLSNRYYESATTYLISELFERHDRDRFELFAVSYGPEGRGVARARIARAADRFIDVRASSDRDVATLLRELGTDIAIDLMGYAGGARPGISALRCAPVQVNYLVYPGTMGASFIDYLIADRFVVPSGSEAHYSEQVVRMPECYQPNDTKRPISERTPSRTELGLPERAFVFCSFNSSYKITPATFDVWMRLLRQVEGSVLWLLARNEAVAGNLRSEASRRGIAPSRLVFAPMLPLDSHLARHAAADLFLDSLPCNAHTTASDALWAGLPVVTCAGRSFAARVAGSLLHAIGLEELVTESVAAYEALALALARDPARLADVRAKLRINRTTEPLFDIERYTRQLEWAYDAMWTRHLRGEPPRAFDVPPLPR
jgi:predicted O-linked N-acetylglucosamine transferase (SPINDLY family)